MYRIEITAPGFRRFVQDGVTLTAGATVRVDAQLQIGQVIETVEVLAQAPQIQTEDAKISTAVENKLVDKLPLVAGGAQRSPFDLVSIVPESKGGGNTLLGGGATVGGGPNQISSAASRNLNARSDEAGNVVPPHLRIGGGNLHAPLRLRLGRGWAFGIFASIPTDDPVYPDAPAADPAADLSTCTTPPRNARSRTW